jgi:hypothetical protein
MRQTKHPKARRIVRRRLAQNVGRIILAEKLDIQAALHGRAVGHDAHHVGIIGQQVVGQRHKAIKPAQPIQPPPDEANHPRSRGRLGKRGSMHTSDRGTETMQSDHG